jgi:addiction module HigA family antidote
MIGSFRGNDTQALFAGGHSKRFRAIQTIANRKLAMLDAAKTLDFMRSPPGNRLEALKGDRAGQWSVRIDDQWRVCFVLTDAVPNEEEIVDQHLKSLARGRVVNRKRAVHPGEVLREEFLVPLSLSVIALATALEVPATRIHEIVKERRGITADTAERLARYFGGDAASCLALQADCELTTLATRKAIARKVSPREAAPE